MGMDLFHDPIRLGKKWALLRKEPCRKCASLPERETAGGTERWLLRVRSDSAALTAIRNSLFHLSFHVPHLGLAPGGDPLEQLARMLEAGELHLCVCAPKEKDTGSGGGGGGGGNTSSGQSAKKSSSGAEEAPPFPLRTSAARSEVVRPKEDPDVSSLLLPRANAVAIAQGQQMAARLGIPFCEECVKSALSANV